MLITVKAEAEVASGGGSVACVPINDHFIPPHMHFFHMQVELALRR